jgi:hypothetical protein
MPARQPSGFDVSEGATWQGVAADHGVGYAFGMTRRRFILAACVAVGALGAAWWLFGDGLLAEEQHVVGTWRLRVDPSAARPAGSAFVWAIGRDRRCLSRELDPTTGDVRRASDGTALEVNGRWHVAEGRLTFDWAGPLDRLRRVIPEGLPGSPPTAAEQIHIVSIGADEVILGAHDGTTYRLVRVTPRH